VVSQVCFTPAGTAEREDGLLGHLAITLNETLRIDGVQLRRTVAGSLALSWPRRRDRNGRDHPIIRPLGDRARRALEHQILTVLPVGSVPHQAGELP
jgi:hypothetical protein